MNIFLVDDHPMTVDGYRNTLSKDSFIDTPLVFTIAYSGEEAYRTITNYVDNKTSFDFGIIDQGFPGYEEQSISSGTDLALLVRKEMPNCKIIMITAHTEVLVIYDIYRKVKPDGLVIKNDIGPNNLQQIVKEVLEGKLYQSPIVKTCMQEIWKKELMVDDYNREILFYLSKGFKLKELDSVIDLSYGAIEKRLAKMKSDFNVDDAIGLVKEAIKLGFV